MMCRNDVNMELQYHIKYFTALYVTDYVTVIVSSLCLVPCTMSL